jgi:hypothetical protein
MSADSGLVVCPVCGWRGVPTFVGGKPLSECPRGCKGAVVPAHA